MSFNIMHKYGKICFLLTTLFLYTSCSTTSEKKPNDSGLSLRYLPKSIIGYEISLRHPAQITEEAVRTQLISLWYDNLEVLGKGGNRVFTDEEADKVSRVLTKALNQANPNNIVRVELTTSKGPTYLEVFVEKDQIHWRFQEINGVVFSCDISLMGCNGINWKLILKNGQRYYSVSKFIGRKNVENWIVADLNPPSPSSKQVKSGKSSSKQELGTTGKKSAPAPDLEDKLDYLKRLYDKGLISEEEYKRNQKKMMDEKF